VMCSNQLSYLARRRAILREITRFVN